mgnify:CR=1 FL=1
MILRVVEPKIAPVLPEPEKFGFLSDGRRFFATLGMPQTIEGKNAMKIEIHHIPTNGLTLEYHKPVQDFPDLEALSKSGECQFIGALTVHLEVLPMRDFIISPALMPIRLARSAKTMVSSILTRRLMAFAVVICVF